MAWQVILLELIKQNELHYFPDGLQIRPTGVLFQGNSIYTRKDSLLMGRKVEAATVFASQSLNSGCIGYADWQGGGRGSPVFIAKCKLQIAKWTNTLDNYYDPIAEVPSPGNTKWWEED